MKLSGACSLNRNGSPGSSARNVRGLGCQKLTSSSAGRPARKRNHSPSVTATKALTGRSPPSVTAGEVSRPSGPLN
jgi:hypothetical protein